MATPVSELPPGFSVDELPSGFTLDSGPPPLNEPQEVTRQKYEAAKKAAGPKDALDFLMGAPRAGQEASPLASALRKGIGVAEAAISTLTGATTGFLGGLAGGLDNVVKQVGYRAGGIDTSKLPSTGEAFDQGAQALTYQPRTETGEDIISSQGMREANNAMMAVSPLGMVGSGTRGLRAQQMAKASTTPRALAAVDSAIKTAKLEAPVNQGIANAIEAGYKLTPKAGNAGAPARIAQTAAGSARLEQELSAHNSKTTADLARRDIGLADDVPLTREATADIRKEAGGDYAAVQNVGRIKLDAQLSKDLDLIAEPYVKGGKDFDQLASNPIIKTIEGLRKTEADTASVVEVVKDLRDKADAQFRGNNGSKKLGVDYRTAAQALDNAMDRSLGRMAESEGTPELAEAVDKYRAARVRIAKSYLLDDAMDGKPGEVNAMVYGRAARDGAKLDGPAKQIADFATQFGDEGLAKKAGKSGHIGPTYHDILLGALHGAEGLLTVGARPLTRAALGSKKMQRRMAEKARQALPAEEAQPAPAASVEPTLERGFEPAAPSGGPATGPLGDLTPDWETAPGAAAPRALEVVPTEGLVPAVGEGVPGQIGPASPAVRRGAGSEIPAVPGRPDLPDTMVVGSPAEVAATEGANKAMLSPETAQARAQQGVQQVATEAQTPPPDPRLAEIERLRANATSDTVHKVLDARAAAIKKELKASADAAELENAARETTDPSLKAELVKKADALRKTEKIPVGEAKELASTPVPETKVKKIPVGSAKELPPDDAAPTAAKSEKIPVGEAKEVTNSGVEIAPGGPPVGEAKELFVDPNREHADLGLPQIDETFMREQEHQAARREPPPDERGIKQARAALEKGKTDGSLDKDGADLALWALDRNPNLAKNLRVSVEPTSPDGRLGSYNSAKEIVRLFKGKDNPETAAHEIMHHSERMMPPAVQNGIRREWRRAYEAALAGAEGPQRKALVDVRKALKGDAEARTRVFDAFKNDVLKKDEHYQLYDPSEFWAVNASRLLSERYAGRGSWRKEAVQWVKEMVQHAKSVIGLRSDSPILKALDQVTNAKTNTGKQQSKGMLSSIDQKGEFVTGTPESYTARRYKELSTQLAKPDAKSNEKLARALPVYEAAQSELEELQALGDSEATRKRIKAVQARVIKAYNGQGS